VLSFVAGEDGNILIPSLVTAAVTFLSCFLYLLLPETKDVEIPRTVEEAVNMKRLEKPYYQKTYWVPSFEMMGFQGVLWTAKV